MAKTVFVVHLTADTGDRDPAELVAPVERALRTADIVNPPGLTGIDLTTAEITVDDFLTVAEPAREVTP